MEMTIQEVKQLDKDSYQIIDIRDDNEIAHGAIPGAVALKVEEIAENPLVDKSKKLVICCSRGKYSQEVVPELVEKGFDAVSLKGGYIAWLMDLMREDQEKDISADVEKSIRKKFRKSIWCKFTKAINQYELVKEGDCIAVCISGGKDSMLMAKLFQELKLHNKFSFDVKFLVMDPGYSPENRKVIEENARKLNVPITIYESDIFEAVFHVDQSPCYLCARMRRGHLYHYAQELGCNKIALGHHYDDVIETILMGMLYGAQVQTMMPKLHSTNFGGMELIRPMYLIREDSIKAWRDYNDLHFIQCACKFTDTCTTCNNEETKSKRSDINKRVRKSLNEKEESQIEKVCFMNMCMIQDHKGNVLALDKVNDSYTGTTFPGGHVEANEIFQKSMIREVWEETGLTVEAPKLGGLYHWHKSGVHYVITLYKADKFTGELKSSEEGRVYWIPLEELKTKELATGMEHVLRILESEKVDECYMHLEADGYVGDLY